MDSFKGTLSADEACAAVRRGWLSVFPDTHVVSVPLADGGEGTAEALKRARGGRWIECTATGPLPDRCIDTRYLWLDEAGPGALVEMAAVNGLTLLRADELAPLRTSTRGTGELIADAVRRGARTLWLTLGGSATVDGGTGMARALGWQFLDAQGRPVPEGGGGLRKLDRIVPPPTRRMATVEVEVLCDVDNPLVGPVGAATVFGPQKGARAAEVDVLEAGLTRLAEVIERDLGMRLHEVPGAGAAGGLGAGALAFLDARLVPGIEAVLRASDFATALENADLVVTGEGAVDVSSFHGKVINGVLDLAHQYDMPVAIVAGRLKLADEELKRRGIMAWADAATAAGSEDDAMTRAEFFVEQAARALALGQARARNRDTSA